MGITRFISASFIQGSCIKESLDLPQKAFSYLISHGDLDQDHQKFFETLVNRLDTQQLAVVIKSCRRFYRLYADIFRGLD